MKPNDNYENSSELESRSEQMSCDSEEFQGKGTVLCKGCEILFSHKEVDERGLCLLCAEDCEFEAGQEEE
jgi:hypothetical protein